jgi:hypothetical protein
VSDPRFTIGDPNGNNAAWVYDGDTKIAKIEEANGDAVLSLVSLAQRAEALTRRVAELEGALKKARDVLYEDALNRLRYMQMSEGGRLMAAKNTVSEYDAALAAKGAA